MTTAIYELLCQAYSYVNSLSYRIGTGDASRMRETRSLTIVIKCDDARRIALLRQLFCLQGDLLGEKSPPFRQSLRRFRLNPK